MKTTTSLKQLCTSVCKQKKSGSDAFAQALSPPPWFLNIVRDYHFAIRTDGALDFSAMLLMHRCVFDANLDMTHRLDSSSITHRVPQTAAVFYAARTCLKINPASHELIFDVDNNNTERQMHISDQHKDKR